MYVPLAYSNSAERLNDTMDVTGYHGVGGFTNCFRLPADTLTFIDLATPSP
jgi:hypothetical protein